MNQSFCDLSKSPELITDAATILRSTFLDLKNPAWSTIEEAVKEVNDCIQYPNICIGMVEDDNLLGWIGLRPMYKFTWELHPLVVKTEYQKQGFGKQLMEELERQAKRQGIMGIALGTDDEDNKTSLSQLSLDGNNIFKEIQNIKNIRNHPFEFYKKCGYCIVGVIPDANGERKPDIWMWKKI